MDAVEHLSAIESTSKEMFILGNEALRQGHVQPAVAVVRKLGGKVRSAPAKAGDGYGARRTNARSTFGSGLVAKVYRLDGSARVFARRHACKRPWLQSDHAPADMSSALLPGGPGSIFTKWPISRRPTPCNS
jgi:hypothetical protein